MKIGKIIFTFTLIAALFSGEIISSAKTLTWMGYLIKNRKKTISVYVENCTNSTDNKNIDVADLKKRIEHAFLTRMSHKFEIAKKESDADIILKGDIFEYYWTEEDPIDMVYGAGAIAMDVVKKDHYVRMQINFSIFLPDTGRRLWNRRLKATITNPTMTEKQSYDMANERMVEVLMRALFKKPKTMRERYSTIG